MPNKTPLVILGGLLVLGLIAATVTLAILYANEVNEEDADENLPTSTPQPTTVIEERINCYPEKQVISQIDNWDVTKEQCDRRGCTYDPNTGKRHKAPTCYMHPDKIGYRVQKNLKSSSRIWSKILHPISNATIFDRPIESIWFYARILNDNHLQFQFIDTAENRYEVPFKPPTFQISDDSNADTASFSLEFTDNPFSLKVVRKSTGVVLFDTSMGGFVFSNRFLQITTRLASENVYGLGEHEHPSLKHDLNYKTWPMFAKDQAGLGEGNALYGVHPVYMVVENDGNSHGVFLMNSNAMEYTFIPAPGVIIRTIGGILDFHLYTGPTPENVVQQHTEYVGRPTMPPYWGLGFHLSRWGYDNLGNMEDAVQRTRAFGIPLDAIYADIDHMDGKKDFTVDEENFGGLGEYMKAEKEQNGLRSVVILDPGVTNNVTTPYEAWAFLSGNDSFVKWPNGTVMFGYVWPRGKVAFPDFFLERTQHVWVDLIARHSKVLPFDGVWIDMNEPSNFGTNRRRPHNWPLFEPPWSLKCAKSDYEDPPYPTVAVSRFELTKNVLRMSDRSLCMEAVQNYGTKQQMKHYDIHSLYGWSQSPPTKRGIQAANAGKRGFVLSRSTFAGSGHYVSHWSGDNMATWTQMRHSIIAMLEMSMFGIPHTGADICGFMLDTTPELCRRWMQLGAFYPYSRNHNNQGNMDQDPGSFGDFVAEPSKKFLLLRYKILPYMYTLFYWAYASGTTVARPLFHEFPRDKVALEIDTQFMLGSGLMYAPVLYQDDSDLKAYLPHGKWLDLVNIEGPKMEPINMCDKTAGEFLTFSDNKDPILFQRGGSVIATQRTNEGKIIATKFTRTQPLALSVVFDCDNTASGSLFWDDGESINTVESGVYWLASYTASFNSTGGGISVRLSHASIDPTFERDLHYETITMYGLPKIPRRYTITCPVVCPPISGLQITTNYGKWVLSFMAGQEPKISTAFDVSFSFDR